MIVPDELLQDLNSLIKQYKHQHDFAASFKTFQSHISQWKRGLKFIPDRVLHPLGWERVTIYRKIEDTK